MKVFPNKPDPEPADVKTFIDVTTTHQVDYGGEKGLLGLAFHPKWPATQTIFLSYTKKSGNGEKPFSRITKFTSKDNGVTADNTSGVDVFDKVQQPYSNHNGGFIAFGKDGYLYYALGDGGAGNDPLGSGQDKNSYLGKILRFDIDKVSPYAIPPDNPFASGGGKPEIFAYGLRNPWRFSFDRDTGDLWAGDVGQDAWEEVDKIQLGGNYGWNTCEGTHLRGDATKPCTLAGAISALAEYQHGSLGGSDAIKNQASITGGYVYRGTLNPSFAGAYFYGDFVHGQIWALQQVDGKYVPKLLTDVGGSSLSPSSFGQDLAGEVYVVSYGGGIYQISPKGAVVPDTFPKLLSQTGCVDPQNPKMPAAGLIPYGPVSPLWSDGAEKQRWFALPDGSTIDFKEDGDFDFPKGTVLVKSFYVGSKIVETRLFMRHNENGEWGGYTYEWNDTETDATLLPSSKLRDVGNGQNWYYPSRGECFACHTNAAGRSLGLEIMQLNSDFVYPNNRLSNQLATFEHIGVFTTPLPGAPTSLGALTNPTAEGGDPTMRARSYLHSNCSNCHRPEGGTRSEQDWRYSTALSAGKACNQDPALGDLGITGGKIVFPGDPTKSILSKRMHSLDVNRMPPLGTRVVDAKGSQVIDDWIKSLTSCN